MKFMFLTTVLSFIMASFSPVNSNLAPLELQDGFLSTVSMSNTGLYSYFEENLPEYFDEVSVIDAHSNDQFGSYYIIYGKKDGKSTFISLAAFDEDLENETYTYTDLSSSKEFRLLDESSSMRQKPCFYFEGGCDKNNPWWMPICGWIGPNTSCRKGVYLPSIPKSEESEEAPIIKD